MQKYVIKVLFFTSFLTSCSLAPFHPTKSARSLGSGNMQAQVGNTNSTYYLSYAIGMGEDFDTGFTMEFGAIQTSALFAKYSLLNNETGPALALEGSYGTADETMFYYLGTVASFAFNQQLEVFTNLRFNSVSTSDKDIEQDEFHGNVKITSENLKYFQFSYGLNVWMSEAVGLSLYSTYFKGDDIETSSDSTFGVGLLINI